MLGVSVVAWWVELQVPTSKCRFKLYQLHFQFSFLPTSLGRQQIVVTGLCTVTPARNLDAAPCSWLQPVPHLPGAGNCSWNQTTEDWPKFPLLFCHSSFLKKLTNYYKKTEEEEKRQEGGGEAAVAAAANFMVKTANPESQVWRNLRVNWLKEKQDFTQITFHGLQKD